MSTIIAGGFDVLADAETAVRPPGAGGRGRATTCAGSTFNPRARTTRSRPAAIVTSPRARTRRAAAPARERPSALPWVAVAGCRDDAFLGPAGILAGAGAGAYAGSLLGQLEVDRQGAFRRPRRRASRRNAGRGERRPHDPLARRCGRASSRNAVRGRSRPQAERGSTASGAIFDPVSPPHLIGGPRTTACARDPAPDATHHLVTGWRRRNREIIAQCALFSLQSCSSRRPFRGLAQDADAIARTRAAILKLLEQRPRRRDTAFLPRAHRSRERRCTPPRPASSRKGGKARRRIPSSPRWLRESPGTIPASRPDGNAWRRSCRAWTSRPSPSSSRTAGSSPKASRTTPPSKNFLHGQHRGSTKIVRIDRRR